ncbi:OsmC family protein [uncultured Jatrophihabitans sp.]|uniref:OsmC family protein n=1 Tax=uncultured Jatrophihabitans sp. TaxID=1610747 RepID=UPI0035CB1451
MATPHRYELGLRWTGNRGVGTRTFRAFTRDHDVTAAGVPTLLGSADPAFRGDPSRWNPEQLLVASLAQCHLLTYLWLAVQERVVVLAYEDTPTGTMLAEPGGSGRFAEVTLHPAVTIADGADVERAEALHGRVGDYCFIARSVNFPVHHDPTTLVTPR